VGPWMREPSRKRHIGAGQRRALQLLASSPFGVSEAVVSANGFTRPMLAGLSRAGLATARGKTVRITAEGRRALEG
jgi:hypothetical protein